jgi:hypothetical protein
MLFKSNHSHEWQIKWPVWIRKEPWRNLHQYNFDHCKSDSEPKIYLKYVYISWHFVSQLNKLTCINVILSSFVVLWAMTLCSLLCRCTSDPHMLLLSIYLSMALEPSVGPRPLSSFLIFYKDGRTPWMGDQPVTRPLHAHRTAQTQKCTQTSMPQVGFEPTIPSVPADKDSSCLRQHSHCDWYAITMVNRISAPSDQGNTGTHLPYQCHTPHDQWTHEMLVPTYMTTKCHNSYEFSTLW